MSHSWLMERGAASRMQVVTSSTNPLAHPPYARPAYSQRRIIAVRCIYGAASSIQSTSTRRPAQPSISKTLNPRHPTVLLSQQYNTSSKLHAYRSSTDADLSGTSASGPGAAESPAEAAAQVVTSEAVTAQDTFKAAAANMPSPDDGTILGQAGRWERWAASSPGQTDRTLISSGQSVYAFQPGAPPGQDTDSAITVHVFEVPDASPLQMTEASTTDKQTALGEEMRMTNTFKVSDIFFEPRLPDPSSKPAHPAAGLRLWAANQHGFAMAPTHLPQELFQQQQQQQQQDGAADDSGGFKMPFIANLYVKHPSASPGIGHRWGWNIQYSPDAKDTGLQHIHHTSLGLVAMQDVESGVQLGVHKPKLLTPVSLPGSIDAVMSEHPRIRCSAVEFTYDNSGQLQRKSLDSCRYTSSEGGMLESWYSSGGYTKVPRELKSLLEAGESVVIEAGAVLAKEGQRSQAEDEQSVEGSVEGVTRWLLRYRPQDGQLESARIEVYTS